MKEGGPKEVMKANAKKDLKKINARKENKNQICVLSSEIT